MAKKTNGADHSLSIFKRDALITYSPLIDVSLNPELVDYAQIKIFQYGMASVAPLEIKEIINSVLNSLEFQKTPDFMLALTKAVLLSLQMRRVKYVKFRINIKNYDKILLLVDAIKSALPQKNESNIDEQIGIAVNSLLILFKGYDLERERMM
jgi:hypothetical protein